MSNDSRTLGPIETDTALGVWRRVRRPGVQYVAAGRLPDGMVELLGTDGEALDEVAEALCQPGTAVRRTQLPQPTEHDLAAIFDRARQALPLRSAPLQLESGVSDTTLVLGLVGCGLAFGLGVCLMRWGKKH